jgi:hypothetical protein
MFATTVCAVLVVGTPRLASAQEPPIGSAVHVTTVDGTRRGGTLVALDHDKKTLVIDQRSGRTQLSLPDVQMVTRDSRAIAAGTVVGLAGGLLTGVVVCGNASDCPMGLAALTYAGIGAGVGVAAGAIIKAARTNSRIVYKAPAKTSISLSPVVGRSQVGVRGVIAW